MNTNEWSDFFDGHAAQYEENCFTKNTAAEIPFLISELDLPPGGCLLDVGCGTGRHAIELAKAGYSVTGLDLSAGMLAEASRRAASAGVEVRWIQANAADFQLQEQFDGAICLCEGSFGLLGSRDDAIGQPLSVLRNISSSLKPGAKCIFTVLNAFWLVRSQTADKAASGDFDALDLAEVSELKSPSEGALRERAFAPTELVLLFALAGLEAVNIWGGTAGNWGKRKVELDEIEIMAVARKLEELPHLPGALQGRMKSAL